MAIDISYSSRIVLRNAPQAPMLDSPHTQGQLGHPGVFQIEMGASTYIRKNLGNAGVHLSQCHEVGNCGVVNLI